MSPRTVAPVALDDAKMRRRVLALSHPDRGGSHELFLWIQALLEAFEKLSPERCIRCPAPRESQKSGPGPEPRVVHEDGRIPFPARADFDTLTRRALEVASEVGDLFAVPLQQLRDCCAMPHRAHEQERGASYKQLASIGHIVGMTKRERGEWYRIAESIPLSQRHAGHIIAAAKKSGAA